MNIPENFDRWMFDYTEGNLSLSETEAFEQFMLNNPSYEAEADAWQNAKIAVAPVSYPNQSQLQRNRKVGAWYSWSAAATIITLLGIVGFYVTKNNTSTTTASQFTKSKYNKESLANSKVNTEMNYAPFAVATDEVNSNSTLTNQINNSQIDLNSPVLTATNTNPLNGLMANNSDVSSNNTEVYISETISIVDNNGFNQNNSKEDVNTIVDENNIASLNISLAQETKKFEADDANTSQYNNNPKLNNDELDLAKKNNVKVNSLASRTKKVYRKIEKKFGYPVGLVNLRDPELLLPENSITAFNPGFTGGMFKQRFEINYRNQWFNSALNSQKARISYDTYVPGLRGGVGFALESNVYGNGALTDHSVILTYSPKIVLSKNVVLEPGVKVEVGMLTGNTARFKGAKAFELERGLPQMNNFTSEIYRTDKLIYKDYGLGLVLNAKRFYAGLSADNIANHFATVYRLEGNVEPNRTPTLLTGIIGADYESANKRTRFSPYILIRKFGEQREAWAGMNFKMNAFTIGGAYATNDNWTIATGMKFKKFKLVYQYDRTSTVLTEEQIGSHSIGIRFTGEPKNTRFKK